MVCCWFGEKRASHAVCVHGGLVVDCFMGKFLIVVCIWTSNSLSSR